jgi:hypothetical protein
VNTVREIMPWKAKGAEEDGLRLVEIVNPARSYRTGFTCELAFRVSRFRLAPDISLFKRMLEAEQLEQV